MNTILETRMDLCDEFLIYDATEELLFDLDIDLDLSDASDDKTVMD